MEPVSTAAAITAASAALAGGANVASTAAANRKQRQFSRDMYAKQKADNIAFWNMQNEYNSPEKQMQRLKAAGLNPNMVYDKGGAITPAGNISTPDVQNVQYRTPDFGPIGQAMGGYFDTRIKQAQYDNLKAQNTQIQNQALLTAAQTLETTTKTDGAKTQNELARAVFNDTAEQKSLENQKILADTKYTLNQDERAAAQNAQSLQEGAERILNMRADRANTQEQKNVIRQTYSNLIKEGRLKELDINLKNLGISPNDPVYARILGQLLPTSTIEGWKNSFNDWVKNYKTTDENRYGGTMSSQFNIFKKFW